MKFGAVAITLIVAACVAAPGDVGVRQASDLVGRSAGTPQKCVRIEQNVALTIADGDSHTLLYRLGPTVWANHLGSSCGFAPNDTLIVEPIGASYCRGDLVRSVNLQSGIRGPSCILNDFVPYTR
jgi:hypothetical protein